MIFKTISPTANKGNTEISLFVYTKMTLALKIILNPEDEYDEESMLFVTWEM